MISWETGSVPRFPGMNVERDGDCNGCRAGERGTDQQNHESRVTNHESRITHFDTNGPENATAAFSLRCRGRAQGARARSQSAPVSPGNVPLGDGKKPH